MSEAEQAVLAAADNEKTTEVPGRRGGLLQSADSRAWTQGGDVD